MRRSWLNIASTGWNTRLASVGLACYMMATHLAAPSLAWQFRDVTPEPQVPVQETPAVDAFQPVGEEAAAVPGITETDLVEATDLPFTGEVPENAPAEDLATNSVAADGPLRAEIPPAAATESPVEQLQPVPAEALQEPIDAQTVGDALADQTESSAAEDSQTIRPVRFSGLTVGESRVEALLESWGDPFKLARGTDYAIFKYRLRPFRQVDVTVENDVVVSILIHLDEPLDPHHCANELKLKAFESVPIPDEFGKVLGLSYPERGVLFSFDSAGGDALVDKISLEPISAEPFLLRALYDFENRFEQNLADLDQALELDNRNAQAYWLKATKLEAVGRYRDALDAINEAVHYDDKNPTYLLTRARMLFANGDHDVATREVEAVLEMADLATECRADGELLLGNLLANGPRPRFKDAMEHHLAAIDLAATLASDRRFAPRRAAKRVLIGAHLAVARNIAHGDYQRQIEVAPKWLSRARALVEEMVSRDQGDEQLRLVVYRDILTIAADLQSPDDPSGVIDDMLREGRRLIAASRDPLDQSRAEWTLGEGVAEAVRLQRLRGANEVALQHADDALVLLQQAAKKRQSTPAQRYLVGRLYFHTGSLHAIHRQNHEEAVQWYEKAYPLLAGEVPLAVLAQPRIHGEAFISMGVSYWKQGNRTRAIDLTEHGTDVLQQAVVDGLLDSTALSIPYGNLASMHKQVGNHSDAKAFGELAASIKADNTIKR